MTTSGEFSPYIHDATYVDLISHPDIAIEDYGVTTKGAESVSLVTETTQIDSDELTRQKVVIEENICKYTREISMLQLQQLGVRTHNQSAQLEGAIDDRREALHNLAMQLFEINKMLNQ